MRRFQNCLGQPTEESAPKTSPSVELCIDTRVPIKRDLFMLIVIQKIVYFAGAERVLLIFCTARMFGLFKPNRKRPQEPDGRQETVSLGARPPF